MRKYWTPIPFLTLSLSVDREGASLRARTPNNSFPILAWSRDAGLVAATLDWWASAAKDWVEAYDTALGCVAADGRVLPMRQERFSALMTLAGRPIPEIERRRRTALRPR